MPPRQVADVVLRDEPGWITFSIDGRLVYPSTGDVLIGVALRIKIVAALQDEAGPRRRQSEDCSRIDFQGDAEPDPGPATSSDSGRAATS